MIREERRMSTDKQIPIIDNMGDIKNVINDESKMLDLLCSDYDRHLICTLFDKVNLELEKGTLKPEELQLFRSGWFGKTIVELEKHVQKNGRKLFPFEIGDKLNYISLLQDVPSLTATYTSPMVISAIGELPLSNEINYWISSGTFSTLPMETALSVCNSLIKAGYPEKSSELLETRIQQLARIRKSEEEEKQYKRSSR